jgi:hypothetical protein
MLCTQQTPDSNKRLVYIYSQTISNAIPVPLVMYPMIPLPNASLVEPSNLCETHDLILSCGHVSLRDHFLVVVVFLVVLSSAFLIVEVAFEVICVVVLTVAAGALVVEAAATELELTLAAGVEAPDAALELAEVARVVPDGAARALGVAELELVLELADPDDAVCQ